MSRCRLPPSGAAHHDGSAIIESELGAVGFRVAEQLHVGKAPVERVGRAGKFQPDPVAHGRMRAVGADDPVGGEQRFALGRPGAGGRGLAAVDDIDDLDAALDRDSALQQALRRARARFRSGRARAGTGAAVAGGSRPRSRACGRRPRCGRRAASPRRSIRRSDAPAGSSRSSERVLTRMARLSLVAAETLSTMRTATPRRVSSNAAESPTGPAPTISTLVLSVIGPGECGAERRPSMMRTGGALARSARWRGYSASLSAAVERCGYRAWATSSRSDRSSWRRRRTRSRR